LKELVVVSGKGGTGKTSMVASFAALSRNKVVADCDVDAADLHLIFQPRIVRTETFMAGKRATIDPSLCSGCGQCQELCRFDAIKNGRPSSGSSTPHFEIDGISCEGCGVCAHFCPEDAIRLEDVVGGEWYVSETRHGPLVHARLGLARENSGKLVNLVRNGARRVATERGVDLIIIDGAPGIGCPVISSVAGADLVLAVAEPTLSGLHDLERVAQLTSHFGVATLVTVNKSDLNPDMTSRIESFAKRHGLRLPGNVRYDSAVTRAQVEGKSVVENGEKGAAEDIRALWKNLMREYL